MSLDLIPGSGGAPLHSCASPTVPQSDYCLSSYGFSILELTQQQMNIMYK